MCFCTPGDGSVPLTMGFCDSEICRQELEKLGLKENVTAKTAQLQAKMQLMWEWIGSVNKVTGIEPPEEFFKWFDSRGLPL